jgi:hypothetical protein
MAESRLNLSYHFKKLLTVPGVATSSCNDEGVTNFILQLSLSYAFNINL